ncbi:hypothetical protein [Spirosoma sordidisoli]|uniref:Uncharacterized protein n=1 Tax=Spirosoma sordidisoli TaxID=2502893 RepID=A0A4Q2UE80_9BACT|nr:hypothetical protein [Spirosoma sordidisoli]RYC67533.1 hypothetical protein EQG79_22745 [Spirosoma sordidisoli]
MTQPTANALHESMLLMKHTPSDIGRVTNALFKADDRDLKALPREAYQHYFDEIGIALLNWTARGQSTQVNHVLQTLSQSLFREPDMKRLPDMTIKQRVGLQLRVLCAQMTLYLQAQTTGSYNAMLLGSRNEVCRTVLRVLYESIAYGGFGYVAYDYQTVWHEVNRLLPDGKSTTDKNIHHHLRELVKKGLAVVDQSGGSVRYRISERGLVEARFHFEGGEPTPPEPRLAEKTKLVIRIAEQDYSMAELGRLIENQGVKILRSHFEQTDRGLSRLTVELNDADVNRVVRVLERFGYQIESVMGEGVIGPVGVAKDAMLPESAPRWFGQ